MYSGLTYVIDCAKGGLTGNKNIDSIAPSMMIWPSRNINIHRGGRESRGGTSHVYAAAITDTPDGRGIYDFQMVDGTQYIITAWNNGKVYKDDTTAIKTGMSTTTYFSFETAGDLLFIADGIGTPQVWTGAAIADIANPATDWSTIPPFQFVLHGRGNSLRLWAANYTGVYSSKLYSTSADFQNFSDASTLYFPIQTGDGTGITAIMEHNDELWAFGKRTSYRIDDTDTDNTNWGYMANQWVGGVAHPRVLVRTPNNDMVAMMEDGEIYSINSVQQYGDYKAASLTRPSFMHEWVREHVDLSKISQFHATFDPTLRAIKFFVIRNGETEVDTAMCYFIDRSPEEAWMIHDNQTVASGYSASASGLIRKSAGVYKVYTQDYSGKVWELETSIKNDNSEAFYAGFTTPVLTFDNPREFKNYRNVQPVIEPAGDFNLSVKWWIDGTYCDTKTISMAGTGSLWNTAVFDTDIFADANLIDTSLSISDVGKRIQLELYNGSGDQDFFISTLMFDFHPRGPKTV